MSVWDVSNFCSCFVSACSIKISLPLTYPHFLHVTSPGSPHYFCWGHPWLKSLSHSVLPGFSSFLLARLLCPAVMPDEKPKAKKQPHTSNTRTHTLTNTQTKLRWLCNTACLSGGSFEKKRMQAQMLKSCTDPISMTFSHTCTHSHIYTHYRKRR